MSILLILIIILLWCLLAYVFRWDWVEAVIWTTLSVVTIFYFGGGL